MQWKTQAHNAAMIMALTGTSYPEGTLETQAWNGTPLSRAKENICRDDPAMVVRLAQMLRRIKIVVRPVAPPADPVAV